MPSTYELSMGHTLADSQAKKSRCLIDVVTISAAIAACEKVGL